MVVRKARSYHKDRSIEHQPATSILAEHHPAKVSGETSTNFTNHPNCRMRAWVQEILAVELPSGFRFQPEAVKGSNVRVVVSKKVKPRRDGQGDWIENSVSDVWRQKPTGGSDDKYETEIF